VSADKPPVIVEEDEWKPVELQVPDWGRLPRGQFMRSFLQPDWSPGDVVDLAELGISIEEGPKVPAVARFEDLNVLPRYALESLRSRGITSPMPIQAQALPLVLSGHDVIGLAQTGSGKTLAFLLPALVHVEAQDFSKSKPRTAASPVVLVLAPTRELAVQISDEAAKVLENSHEGRHRGGLKTVCLYGGGSKQDQRWHLSRGAQFVIATPGRLIDLISTHDVSLLRVTYFVLDEADRMLDMGFQGDVAMLSSHIRPERQVLFFSATWGREVQQLAAGLCYERSPVRISAGTRNSEEGDALRARKGIVQEVVVIDMGSDWEAQAKAKRQLLESHLRHVLEESPQNKVLVFVSQKTLADELSKALWEDGFHADAMHGGKSQESRLWVLEQFRQGKIRLLVVTDVLSRGIDIPNVSHVVIHEMGGIEDYVHRIGRTARGVDGHGRALVFFEYYSKQPELAGQLVTMLEASEQVVPPELRAIAEDVRLGRREVWQDWQDPRQQWRAARSSGWASETRSRDKWSAEPGDAGGD